MNTGQLDFTRKFRRRKMTWESCSEAPSPPLTCGNVILSILYKCGSMAACALPGLMLTDRGSCLDSDLEHSPPRLDLHHRKSATAVPTPERPGARMSPATPFRSQPRFPLFKDPV